MPLNQDCPYKKIFDPKDLEQYAKQTGVTKSFRPNFQEVYIGYRALSWEALTNEITGAASHPQCALSVLLVMLSFLHICLG